ncbi:M20 family metallopeptidase [Paenibacillus mesophilus]|uniref:M20 family metallopeptidase n=1 Tax=Paenibacillus mesophilus TaxID=2582849 RepID=UPI001EE45993|nr:M20 family metallopeptidase [Paenibacillus mesophilus]
MGMNVNKDRIAEVLGQLVSIPSVNPGFPGGMGEEGVADYVSRFFQRLGLERIEQQVEPGRRNVIGILPGSGPGALLLEAHMDTVQTEGMTIDPFGADIRDGRLYGRGACDTKASLASMLVAIETLATRGIVPPVSVHLAAVVDEEITYKGVTAVADEIAAGRLRYDAAIVGEPTRLDIIVAHKGCVRFHIDAVGIACHSSTPHLGANAIEGMLEAIDYLKREAELHYPKAAHPLVGSPTHCVSMIQGGIAPNTVPESCRIMIDRRTVPGEEPMEVWRNMKERVEPLQSSVPGVRYVVREPFLIDYAMEVKVDEPIVGCLQRSRDERADGRRIIGATYGSDASKLVRVGVPAVVFGPGNLEQAHTKDEWVDLDEVATASNIIVQTILTYK